MGKADNKSSTPAERYIDFPMQFEVATKKATYPIVCTASMKANDLYLLSRYREQMLTIPWLSPSGNDNHSANRGSA